MSDSPHAIYAARRDATAETELSALAAIYKLCLESRAKQKAAGVGITGGDDAMKGTRDDRAKTIMRDG